MPVPFSLALILSAAVTAGADAPTAARPVAAVRAAITADAVRHDVAELSSDDMGGRYFRSPFAEKAAAWISKRFDAIGLAEGERLIALLAAAPRVRGVIFGHVHQHWQGSLPGRPEVPLLGCPSTLIGYGPVQPCPLGRPDDPGGRLLELASDGEIRHRLLRWPALECP